MKIKVDTRENTLMRLLRALNNDYELGIVIESKRLDIGDVIICSDQGEELLIVERKKLSDLASSLRDGRYKEQSFRLNAASLHNHNIIYLIEGNMSSYSGNYSKVEPSTLYVSMFCLQYYKGFSVIRTFDISETAEYLLRMTDKLNREDSKFGHYHDKFVPKNETYTEVISQSKKANITPENIGEIILSQIPGVSTTTAKAILKPFGSLCSLLAAIQADQRCLEGSTYVTKKGQTRKVSQTSIRNIYQYLLYSGTKTMKVAT